MSYSRKRSSRRTRRNGMGGTRRRIAKARKSSRAFGVRVVKQMQQQQQKQLQQQKQQQMQQQKQQQMQKQLQQQKQ